MVALLCCHSDQHSVQSLSRSHIVWSTTQMLLVRQSASLHTAVQKAIAFAHAAVALCISRPVTAKPSTAMQRRLSSAKRPPSKQHDRPRHDLPVVIDQQGNHVIEVEPGVTAPADAVLGPKAGSQPLSTSGCLSLFNSAAATNKYFVRTSKPAAGASLNVSTHVFCRGM